MLKYLPKQERPNRIARDRDCRSKWRAYVAAVKAIGSIHNQPRTQRRTARDELDHDMERFDELASGKLARWRELSTEEIEDAGQQEFLNWVCLGGAMHALGREPEIVDYVESYIFNSDKCFALFHP